MSVLTSKENPKVKHWAKLASDARYRKSEGRALLEGPHLVAAWRQTRMKAAAIIVTEQALEKKEISDLAGMTPVIVSEGVFGSIVEADNPPGIAAEIEIPKAKAKEGSDVVFLEGVQDPEQRRRDHPQRGGFRHRRGRARSGLRRPLEPARAARRHGRAFRARHSAGIAAGPRRLRRYPPLHGRPGRAAARRDEAARAGWAGSSAARGAASAREIEEQAQTEGHHPASRPAPNR